jgi:hypothetical protein
MTTTQNSSMDHRKISTGLNELSLVMDRFQVMTVAEGLKIILFLLRIWFPVIGSGYSDVVLSASFWFQSFHLHFL